MQRPFSDCTTHVTIIVMFSKKHSGSTTVVLRLENRHVFVMGTIGLLPKEIINCQLWWEEHTMLVLLPFSWPSFNVRSEEIFQKLEFISCSQWSQISNSSLAEFPLSYSHFIGAIPGCVISLATPD